MVNKGRILVVDDEAGIRQGCERVLKPAGYLVDKASSILEGVQAVRSHDYDIVLLDVMLPDGHGIDLLRHIHEQDPEIVCIIITGYATVELAVQAIKRGAYDFISKPFNADLLLLTVVQGMEKRSLSLEAKRLSKIEQEAKQLAHEKEEMQRIDQYKTKFMWTMAHELRSPVTGSLSLLRTLMYSAGSAFTPQQTDILERVQQRMDRLMDLINDLLVLAESKTIESDDLIVSISILPLLREIIDRFNEQAISKSIQMEIIAPNEKICVLGTKDGLDTIFSNLLDNAIKYTMAGGKVVVRLVCNSEWVEISVEDNGIGIPEDEIPELGEEFYRATNARKSKIIGTGLGLSIVKQYTEKFGGRIDIRSLVGQGTKITVKLKFATTTNP